MGCDFTKPPVTAVGNLFLALRRGEVSANGRVVLAPSKDKGHTPLFGYTLLLFFNLFFFILSAFFNHHSVVVFFFFFFFFFFLIYYYYRYACLIFWG